LDLIQDRSLVEAAWAYFRDEQTTNETYMPFITDDDPPAIEKNAGVMAEFRRQLEPLYYDPSRFDSYLEQLGVDYPQLEDPDAQ